MTRALALIFAVAFCGFGYLAATQTKNGGAAILALVSLIASLTAAFMAAVEDEK